MVNAFCHRRMVLCVPLQKPLFVLRRINIGLVAKAVPVAYEQCNKPCSAETGGDFFVLFLFFMNRFFNKKMGASGQHLIYL
ncbi:MAG: hypothetical protein ACIWVG_12495, partial [Gloeotrichia echinulata HAB0833]